MKNSVDTDQMASLIWIYTVFKGNAYPSSAGQGLRHSCMTSQKWNMANRKAPKADVTEVSIRSGPTLFSLITLLVILNNNDNEQILPTV